MGIEKTQIGQPIFWLLPITSIHQKGCLSHLSQLLSLYDLSIINKDVFWQFKIWILNGTKKHVIVSLVSGFILTPHVHPFHLQHTHTQH